MVLNTAASISFSQINSTAYFTNGNLGINTTNPSANLDVAGTINASGLSSLANVTATNVSASTLIATTRVSSGLLSATNVTATNVSAGILIGTTITGANMSLSGNLNIAGTLTTVNITSTNLVQTNVSTGTLYASGTSTLQNVTATNITVGTLTASTSLISIGNSNTVGNIYTTGGNVGIGTGSPVEKLEVRGNLRIGNSSRGNYISFHGTTLDGPNEFNHTYIGERIYGGTEASELLLFKGNDSDNGAGPDRIRHLAGNHVFATYTSALSGTFEGVGTSGTTRMTIVSSGNVGIGTTAPSALLDVRGNIAIALSSRFTLSNTVNDNFIYAGNTVGHYSLSWNDDPGSLGGPMSYLSGYGGIRMFTIGTPRVTIVSSGNVGIGTTSPAYTLDVNGTGRFANGLTIATASPAVFTNKTITSNPNFGMIHCADRPTAGNLGSFLFANADASVAYISINTPAYTLDVNGTANVSGTAKIGGNNIYNKILALYDSVGDAPTGATNFYGFGINGGTLRYQVPSANAHLFYTGSTGSMIIATGGNIGIGTQSPRANLEITQSSSTTGTMLYSGADDAGVNRLIFHHSHRTQADYQKVAIQSQALGAGQSARAHLGLCVNTSLGSSNVTMSDAKLFIHGSSGNVGIATTSPDYTLSVGTVGYGIDNGIYIGDSLLSARWLIKHGNSNLNLLQNNGSGTYLQRGTFANSTGTYSAVSDMRIKKDIQPISSGLNEIANLNPVSYLMEDQTGDSKRNFGFIAQDVESVLPEVVNTPKTENDLYTLQYTSIIPVLTKAIQELTQRLEDLQQEFNNYKASHP